MENYVIHLTKECNCHCLYCYETDKTSTYKWNEIKQFIDDIIANNKDKEFTIEFLGGEPMLAFPFIKNSINYIESIKDINVPNYMITTNGTIVDYSVIEFLEANPKVLFGISLDGNKTMNQLRTFKGNNKNTYDETIKNIEILLRNIDVSRLSVHMVTHPYNIAMLNEGIDDLYEKGIRNFGIGTVEHNPDIDDQYCERYIKELKILSDRIVNKEFDNIFVDVLNSLKPKSDERKYIRSKDGKVLGETYGRTQHDLTEKNIYNVNIGKSSIGDTIYNIRETVYNYHQSNLKKCI